MIDMLCRFNTVATSLPFTNNVAIISNDARGGWRSGVVVLCGAREVVSHVWMFNLLRWGLTTRTGGGWLVLVEEHQRGYGGAFCIWVVSSEMGGWRLEMMMWQCLIGHILSELIDELILLMTHLKYYDGPNCDLIKYKDLLVIIMGSDNKIKIKIK